MMKNMWKYLVGLLAPSSHPHSLNHPLLHLPLKPEATDKNDVILPLALVHRYFILITAAGSRGPPFCLLIWKLTVFLPWLNSTRRSQFIRQTAITGILGHMVYKLLACVSNQFLLMSSIPCAISATGKGRGMLHVASC